MRINYVRISIGEHHTYGMCEVRSDDHLIKLDLPIEVIREVINVVAQYAVKPRFKLDLSKEELIHNTDNILKAWKVNEVLINN